MNLQEISRKHNFILKLNEDIINNKLNKAQFADTQIQNIVRWCEIMLFNSDFISRDEKMIYRKVYLSFLDDESYNSIQSHVVSNLRNNIKENRREGLICPCCDNHVKEYRKNLSSNACRFLISLVALSKSNTKNDGWIHHTDCVYTSRDYPAVSYWNLAISNRDDTGEKRTTGFWKPTQQGIDFVYKKLMIDKYVYTYNGKVIRFSENEKVSITDCLGNKFNYNELMNS